MSRKQEPPNQAAIHASSQDTLVLVPAGVLCLCRADRTMPIGPISLNQNTTPHPVPPQGTDKAAV